MRRDGQDAQGQSCFARNLTVVHHASQVMVCLCLCVCLCCVVDMFIVDNHIMMYVCVCCVVGLLLML